MIITGDVVSAVPPGMLSPHPVGMIRSDALFLHSYDLPFFASESAVKGLVRVGQGFSVNAATLGAGGLDVSELLDRCLLIAQDAVEALQGMPGATGHAGLASVLTSTAGQAARTFWAMGAAYQHVSTSLVAAAETYSSTERSIASRAATIFGEGW